MESDNFGRNPAARWIGNPPRYPRQSRTILHSVRQFAMCSRQGRDERTGRIKTQPRKCPGHSAAQGTAEIGEHGRSGRPRLRGGEPVRG